MGATYNAGFDANVQQNLGLYFVTKQHKSLQKLQPVYSLVWHVNFPAFVVTGWYVYFWFLVVVAVNCFQVSTVKSLKLLTAQLFASLKLPRQSRWLSLWFFVFCRMLILMRSTSRLTVRWANWTALCFGCLLHRAHAGTSSEYRCVANWPVWLNCAVDRAWQSVR